MHRAAASSEHREQLCWSTWRSSSLGADTGAPLEHMEQLLPWSAKSSFAGARGLSWSSGSLGADTGAPLEHVEQWLSGSRYSCSIVAHGAAASLDYKEQLCWSTWSSGSLGADTGAPVEHMEQQRPWSTESSCVVERGAVALWEQIQVFPGAAAFQEHTEQLCWYICSSGAIESTTREVLLRVLQWSNCICSQRAAAPHAPA